jgi:RNA polymerase sigma factor (sigma-70 family)
MGNGRWILNTPSGHQHSEIVGNLFKSHAPEVRSFCRRLLSDANLADDAVQQTFEIALKSYGALRDSERSRAWIFQIARNECFRILDHPRSMELDEEQMADLVSTPLHGAIDADVRSIVRGALDCLPHIYREAVLLRDMEGFTYAEIAGITGMAVSAVKFRIFKGRELLMEKLQPVLKEWRMP